MKLEWQINPEARYLVASETVQYSGSVGSVWPVSDPKSLLRMPRFEGRLHPSLRREPSRRLFTTVEAAMDWVEEETKEREREDAIMSARWRLGDPSVD
jgi:hypothetical protein